MSYAVHPDIFCQKLEGKLLFLVPGQRRIHFYLTDVGAEIWEQVVRKVPPEQIAKHLAERYGVSESRAASDVKRLLRDLLKMRIIIRR